MKQLNKQQENYDEARYFDIAPSIPPEEMVRRVRLAFKKMPEESALIVFAKVMTSDVPHDMKVAVWDAVRYSHIWWHVDDVLTGDVMENPIVQCAFADAVAMRCWRVAHGMDGWEYTQRATRESSSLAIGRVLIHLSPEELPIHWLVWVAPCCKDSYVSENLLRLINSGDGRRFAMSKIIAEFQDYNGNNALWYLTYRDDQQAEGGFACPKTEKLLIDLGVDPNQRNKIGLCWNDVARHVNRPERK